MAAVSWALTEAPVDDPLEALYLVAMADNVDHDGRGCWASLTTLAAHARVSRRTAQRLQQRLEDAGLIVPGDEAMVAHLRGDRRPRVWDLTIPARGVTLTPRADDGVTGQAGNGAPRGVTNDIHGVSPVAHKPSTNPLEKPARARQDSPPASVLLELDATTGAAIAQCAVCRQLGTVEHGGTVPLHTDPTGAKCPGAGQPPGLLLRPPPGDYPTGAAQAREALTRPTDERRPG